MEDNAKREEVDHRSRMERARNRGLLVGVRRRLRWPQYKILYKEFWTLETLVQAAQQVIPGQPAAPDGESSPEKTKTTGAPEMRTLVVKDIRICSVQATSAALLDSGATHCLRSAANHREWTDAEKVMVELAGNHMLQMRMTSGGTLLMPYRDTRDGTSGVDRKLSCLLVSWYRPWDTP